MQRKQVCMLVTDSHKGKEVAAIASPPCWNCRALQMAMAAPICEAVRTGLVLGNPLSIAVLLMVSSRPFSP